MKKLLPMLLLASFAMKNSIQAQSYVDFQNAVYYTASGNTLTSSGQTLAAFDYGTASPSHPIFNDGVYFPKKDYLGNNIWLRVIHIADDPNGTGVGYFVDKTASSPFRDNGFGGWFGFLYQFEVYADATLTGIASNTLNGLFPSNVRVESIETLSAGEWLTFESLNNESTAWALNSIGTGSNPGFSPTVMYYGPGFTSEFPPDSKMINAVDLGGTNFASFAMSAESVSQFRYGYEYSYYFGYQGIRVYLGNAGLPRVRIQRTAGTSPSCSNTGVTFTATPIGWPDVPDYQWKINGSNVGSNSPTYSSSSLINGDKIVCQLTSTSVAATTSNIILQSIYTPPTIAVSISPLSNTACAGSDKIFNTTVTNGGSNPSYQWKLNGNDITGETQQTYSVSGLQAGNQISCSFTRADGICGTSTSNVVTMADFVPTINITSNIPGTICAGTNVTFTASSTNAGISPIYQWKLNDVNVGTNSPNYSNATLVDNDVVKCEVNNGCNTFTSNSLNMSVNLVPSSVTISMFNNQSTTICQGNYAGFTAIATNSGVHPTYKWKKNGVVVQTYSGLFTDNTSFYSTNNLNNFDTITCEMISQVACTGPATSNKIGMTVNPVNNASVSIAITNGTNPNCSGGPLTFTATPTNGGTTPIYEWHRIAYFPAYNTIVGTNSPTLTLQNPEHNDTYYCNMMSSTVCSSPFVASSNSITVKAPSFLNGYISCNSNCNGSPNISTCGAATIEFYANSYNVVNSYTTINNSPTYQWQLNGNPVGTNSSTYSQTGFADGDIITCDVVSTEPCSTPPSLTLSMTVSVYDVSTATLSVAGPSEVCSGNLPTYYANAANAGSHPAYQWKKNGLDVADATLSYYTPDIVAVNDVIACVLTTDPACSAPLTVPSGNTIIITAINPTVVPTISIAASNPLSATSNTFTATISNGGSDPGYYWYKNGSYMSYGSNTYTDALLAVGDVLYCQLYSDATCANPSNVNSNSLTVIAPPSYCTPSSNQGNQPCDYVWLTNVQMGTSLNKSTVCDGFYSNFTATDTLKAAAGETVNYSITGGSDGSNWYHRRAVYIDFNNDKDFDDAGEMVLDLYAGALDNTTGTFTLPSPLATGNYRMRVIASNDIDFSPCHTNGGEAEDYTLTISYCTPHSPGNFTACQTYYTSNVTLGSNVNNSTGCDGFYSDYSATQVLSAAVGQTINYSVSLGSVDAQNWGTYLNIYIDYNNNGSFYDAGEKIVDNQGLDVSSPATGNFSLPELLPYGSYRIRVVASSGGTITPSACELDYGEAEDYTLLIAEPAYCTPVISQPCDQWLSQVTIGSISNNIAQPAVCTAGGYTDYTTLLSTTEAPGSTVNFSLVGGSSLPFQQLQYADIFVDFNNDGDFDDVDERVVQDFSFYAGLAYTGTFNIPAGQPYGYYRVRVKSYNYDSNVDTYSGPCGNNTNGAVQDYRLVVNCVPNGSDITVQGNNVDIADGDNTPDLADFTDFGNVQVNTSFSRTFTIKNTGTAPLQITGNPTFSGGYQYNFSILNYPSSYLLQPDESTSFTVQVNIPSWAYAIALNTIVHVPTDNCDKKDYDFAINATGSCPAGGPDANLQGNGIDIPAGAGTVSTATGTDFGTVNTGSTVSHTFTVQNLGVANLNISGVIFHSVYNGNGHFSVTAQPASVVPAGGSTTFTIAFSPVDVSSDFAYVYFQSDDCDESYYSFTIQGSGAVPPCTPHSWTSAANNGNWNDPANWCDGVVPTATDDIIIPAGNTPYPVLSTNAAIQNMEIQSGATVTVDGNTLTVNGAVSGAGTISVASTSNIETNASTSLLFTPGSNTLKTLTVNAGTTTLGNALNITAGSSVPNSTGTVTIIPGAVLASNGNLTFKSNEFGTARLAQGSDAGNFVTGQTTVERYIPNNSFRSWRLLSVPTHGSGQTIRQAWQEGTANPLPQQNNLPGYGTQITGTGSLASAQAAGFDNVATSAAMLYWNVNAWGNITNTNTAIDNKQAYFLYIRGERSKGITGATTNSSATTLRTKGNLYTGNQLNTIAANSFVVIPNLYPSAIDFTGLGRTGGVSNLFYIWDSKKLSGNSLGVYQTFSGTNNFNCMVSGGSYTLGQPNTVIESGQAFFVQTGNSSGTLTLKESSKVSGTNGSLGFRPSAVPAKIDCRLYNGTEMADANTIVFDAAYSNATDENDAPKLGNSGENFAIERYLKILAVEGRQPANENDTIQFRMWNMQAHEYKLEFVCSNMNTNGLMAMLEDSYLNTRSVLDLTATTTLSFTVDANAASAANNRLRIVFKQITPLPVSFISISATKQNAGIQVEWKVTGESRILKYEVECSADGQHFVTAGTVTATGIAGNTTAYNWLDANAFTGTTFYRIKSIGINGEVKYSSIVKVVAGNTSPAITVSPNPVKGSTINLQFTNELKGRYSIQLISNTGQTIFTSNIEHAGGNSNYLLNLPAYIANAVYQLVIIDPAKEKQIQTLMVNNK